MIETDEIEQAAALAEAETGARGSAAKLRLCMPKVRNRKWISEEEQFVRENHGRLSEEEISAHLGRTLNSVHIRISRELHLVVPSKSPEILTAEQVAWGLGVDGKSVHLLMDRGMMPRRLLPGKDLTRVIDRRVLLCWVMEPEHWCYFKPERVGAMRPRGKRMLSICYDSKFWEDVREVITRARQDWKDEWMKPGQAAQYLGLPRHYSRLINKAIHCGNIKATRWGNWWVRRSDLPAKDMTITSYGDIVKKSEVRRWKY